MHPELRQVAGHMKEIGLGILSQAQKNTFFRDDIYIHNEGVFGVIQSAHAAEILIKACIAEQHPLLIFSHLPKSTSSNDALLSIKSLINSAKTITYNDLPERLWATTGYEIKELDIYNSFGKLRNTIQHFAVPDRDLQSESGVFIYNVIDPLIGYFWDLYAVNYCDDEEPHYNLLPSLIGRGIDFRCPNDWTEYAREARKEHNKQNRS